MERLHMGLAPAPPPHSPSWGFVHPHLLLHVLFLDFGCFVADSDWSTCTCGKRVSILSTNLYEVGVLKQCGTCVITKFYK